MELAKHRCNGDDDERHTGVPGDHQPQTGDRHRDDGCRRGGIRQSIRTYSLVTIAILLACGGVTFLEAPALAANLPTPWLGVWERINIGVFLLWVAVPATRLLRTHPVR
jgi:hypothetical protein